MSQRNPGSFVIIENRQVELTVCLFVFTFLLPIDLEEGLIFWK